MLMVGIPTNICRVSLILVHTKSLQSGLARKMAALPSSRVARV